MRRLWIIAGILLPVFLLSGCGVFPESNNERPALEFKSDLEIQFEKLQVTANIVRNVAYTQIEFVKPESLKGLKILHSESENAIIKNDLAYKTDSLILPGSSDVVTVFEVLDYIAKNQDETPFYKDSEEMAFIGQINTGKFELRATRETGLITEIKIRDKTTVKFVHSEKL